MSEFTMDRLRENLEALKMKNTLEILDNYLERAVADKLNIVEVLDHIFSEEAKSKRRRAYEKQIQMSGFPIKKTLDDFDFSFQPSIDKRQIDELATMRFLENAEKVFLILDNLNVHHGKLAASWLEKHKDKIEVFFLQPYAPEYNPDEYLHHALKISVHTGQQPYTREDLCHKIHLFMRKL